MFNGTNGYSLADVAAATRSNDYNNDGLGFGGGWWVILLFLFVWGRGGWGGYGEGTAPCATQADVRAAVDQQTLISKLDQQTYGLADSTYSLNNTITNGFHGVDNAICNLGYQAAQHANDLSHQLADCCCSTQRALERGFADTNYNMATQFCDTRRTITDSTRDIIDNTNAGVRSILDFLTQDKIATLQSENQTLRFAASQQAQNNYLVETLRPSPIPAYTVTPPQCTYGYGIYGYNAACGCNS